MADQTITREKLIERLRHYGEVTPDCEDNPTRRYMRQGADMLEKLAPVTVPPMSERVREQVIAWLSDAADEAETDDVSNGIFPDHDTADVLRSIAAMLSPAPNPTVNDPLTVGAPAQGQEAELRQQRDKLLSACKTTHAILERDGDEWGICAMLEVAMAASKKGASA